MFRILGIHPQGVLKRASLKLLEMFCVRSRCFAACNLDLWCVCLVHQAHTPQVQRGSSAMLPLTDSLPTTTTGYHML